METDFHRTGTSPAVAICAAFLLPAANFGGAPGTSEGSAAGPAEVMMRAGTTGAEIQEALDALPDVGGEVILPAGDFAISGPVVLRRDNQSLCGAGPATVLRLVDNANCPAIIMGEPTDHPRRTTKHLLVSDLSIDGNRAHQGSEVWRPANKASAIRNNGITVQAVDDSAVVNVTCAHCRSGGLVTTLGVHRLSVQHLEAFDNQFDGLACYATSDCQFANLYLHDNPCAGISLDLAFDRNCVTNAVLTANDVGIFMRASCGNRFQNISIRSSRHYGVFIAQADVETPRGWELVAHSECTDNVFVNLLAANCGGPGFQVNNASCTNNVVTSSQASAAFRDEFPANDYAAAKLAKF